MVRSAEPRLGEERVNLWLIVISPVMFGDVRQARSSLGRSASGSQNSPTSPSSKRSARP